MEFSRPLKINPTLAKLEQAEAFLRKVFPEAGERLDPGRAPSAQSSPGKPASPRASTPPSPSRTWGHASPLRALQPFHKVSLRTVQMVVAMETDAHPSRPSLTVSVSGMKGSLTMRHGPKLTGQSEHASHTHTHTRVSHTHTRFTHTHASHTHTHTLQAYTRFTHTHTSGTHTLHTHTHKPQISLFFYYSYQAIIPACFVFTSYYSLFEFG